ncbi:hypothetical protein B0H34DRAFT_718972 [Crassisporium funariophilum]|nr:hypothetical protein B0H34DRAFT_718972 [Crassisporium funariophilum]
MCADINEVSMRVMDLVGVYPSIISSLHFISFLPFSFVSRQHNLFWTKLLTFSAYQQTHLKWPTIHDSHRHHHRHRSRHRHLQPRPIQQPRAKHLKHRRHRRRRRRRPRRPRGCRVSGVLPPPSTPQERRLRRELRPRARVHRERRRGRWGDVAAD